MKQNEDFKNAACRPLISPRLRLKPLSSKDASLIYALRANPDIVKYTGIAPYTKIQEAEEYISCIIADMEVGKSFTWTASLQDSGEQTGSVCLFNFDRIQGQAEVGYDLLMECWGRGFATEIVKSVLDFGFDDLSKDYIFALLCPENTASVRLLEKLGFF